MLGKKPVLRASPAPPPPLQRGLTPKGTGPPAPRVSSRKPSEPPSHFLTQPGAQSLLGLNSELSWAGESRRGTSGASGPPTVPALRLRPHVRTSPAATWGSFFPFFFFFFKLSLLSLLGATWWCAGGVSLPPRAPPFSLSAPSRPPLFFPPQWMEAGRLQARSAL